MRVRIDVTQDDIEAGRSRWPSLQENPMALAARRVFNGVPCAYTNALYVWWIPRPTEATTALDIVFPYPKWVSRRRTKHNDLGVEETPFSFTITSVPKEWVK